MPSGQPSLIRTHHASAINYAIMAGCASNRQISLEVCGLSARFKEAEVLRSVPLDIPLPPPFFNLFFFNLGMLLSHLTLFFELFALNIFVFFYKHQLATTSLPIAQSKNWMKYFAFSNCSFTPSSICNNALILFSCLFKLFNWHKF